MRKYYESNEQAIKNGYTLFDTTPTTFVISGEPGERDLHSFDKRFRELANGGSRHEKVPFKHCG